MRDFYLWRVIRDLTYSAFAVYSVYFIVTMISSDRDISVGEAFFVLFLLIGIICLIGETDDEEKPRRFTVKLDSEKYQCDEYKLNIAKKHSHIIMNRDEYVAISNPDTVSIIRNEGHPDRTQELIDISEIIKNAENFAQECAECNTETSEGIGMENPYKKKRTAPNAGKKMSEEQKQKISKSLKKTYAEKKAQDSRIAKTKAEKMKRDLRK